MLKAFLKNIFKQLHIYHPLQLFYRNRINQLLKIKYRVTYRKYAGSGFQCNVCSSAYTKFVPEYPTPENKAAIDTYKVVAGYGEHISCPNCLSTARERLLIAFLKDHISIKGLRILQFSPEKNIYDYLKKEASVVTADLVPGFYKSIDKTIQQQNATALDYADNTFDLIIANHIFEHIPQDRAAMREIYRVLKSGGKAILQVPYSEMLEHTIETPGINDPALQSKLYGQNDHVRIYSLSDYINRLKSVGFDVAIHAEILSRYSIYAVQPGEKLLLMTKRD